MKNYTGRINNQFYSLEILLELEQDIFNRTVNPLVIVAPPNLWDAYYTL